MKIVYSTGCISEEITIDNKNYNSYSKEEIKKILHKMLDKVDNIADLQEIMSNLCEIVGYCKDLGQCEQCGDWVYDYTVEL